MADIKYGDYKTTIKVVDSHGDPIAEMLSWKEKVAKAIITMIKELRDEGIPVAGIPGDISISLMIEKNKE